MVDYPLKLPQRFASWCTALIDPTCEQGNIMPAYERTEVGEARQLPDVLTKPVTWPSFKAAFDSAFSFMALLFLAPILLLVAGLIRLDSPGPVLFRQTRTGLNGRPFRIYKFRTMRVQDDGLVVQQAQRGDSRVTRIGRFLRSTSIDELPQLMNVLRGEMALVGPRPHAMAHDTYYGQEIAIYNRRFAVRPGLTGWAQVSGSRGETPTVTDMLARVELDLWYVENHTPVLDLKILVQTIVIELSRRNGAY